MLHIRFVINDNAIWNSERSINSASFKQQRYKLEPHSPVLSGLVAGVHNYLRGERTQFRYRHNGKSVRFPSLPLALSALSLSLSSPGRPINPPLSVLSSPTTERRRNERLHATPVAPVSNKLGRPIRRGSK